MWPTAAYVWNQVTHPYAVTRRAYLECSNELDALTPGQVNN